jgi:Zn-dependent peptidase ImmA (M78 family)
MTYQEVILLVVDFQKNSEITQQPPMAVDRSLLKKASSYLKFPKNKHMRVVPIETSSRLILGKLRHFGMSVDIAINENALNTCWTRFVIVKELAHLIMSKNGEGITGNMEQLVANILQSRISGADDIEHENFAIDFAIEYLMPYEISQPLLKDATKTDLEIAELFKLPEVAIQIWRESDNIKERDEAYNTAMTHHSTIQS